MNKNTKITLQELIRRKEQMLESKKQSKTATTAFQAIWTYGVSAFTNIKNAVVSNQGSFSGILTILGGLKDALFSAFEFCNPALNWVKDVGLPLVVNALSGVISGATAVYNFFANNWNLIAPIIAGIAGAIIVYQTAVAAVNIVQGAWAAIQGVCTAAQWALNAAMTANPIGIIIVAIGALIAIGVAMWMNWDSICAWCKNAFQSVSDFFVSAGSSIGSFFSNLWLGISSGAVSGVNGLINGVNKVTGAVGIPAIPTFTAPQIPMLATGGVIRTRGTVIVGEKGPEMLSLPRGAQVTPLANKPLQRTENHFHINIYADGKSVEDIID